MGLLGKNVFNLKKNESQAVNPEVAQFGQKLLVLDVTVFCIYCGAKVEE